MGIYFDGGLPLAYTECRLTETATLFLLRNSTPNTPSITW